MDFITYLKKISKQDNIIGDIAGDALRDKEFLKIKEYPEQKEHLIASLTHSKKELVLLLSNFEKKNK